MIQLNMTFSERRNRFRESLEHGEFTLLIESAPPEAVVDPASGAAQLAELEKTVLSVNGINTALAIPDRGAAEGTWRGIEYAASLPEENRDRHLVYFSGVDTDPAAASALIGVAANAGIPNLVAVSGEAPAGISARDCRKRTFLESTAALRIMGEREGIFAGATVNPYEYTPYALFGQYFKLAKKFRRGAGFVVTQAGWDMLKLQSLQWYLAGREFCFPAIARLILLSPDRAERISAGEWPGIRISDDFRKILDKELCYSKAQFEAAQYRRIELQAAGCRLLGFSGVQISGAEFPVRARIVAERIAAAIAEYTSFEQWLDEYNSYMASAEMAPFHTNFHLYDRILSRKYPVENPPRMNDIPDEPPTAMERVAWRMRRLLFAGADLQDSGHARFLKTLFAGCRGCDFCRLPRCEFICPELCPKGMTEGPCGGVRADGRCELSDNECIHSRIVKMARFRRHFAALEEDVDPSR